VICRVGVGDGTMGRERSNVGRLEHQLLASALELVAQRDGGGGSGDRCSLLSVYGIVFRKIAALSKFARSLYEHSP
jgi:hypothetical protein